MSGLTKDLRAFLMENPEGRLNDLYVSLEGKARSFKELNRALERLARRGELTLPDQGYRYKEKTDARRESAQHRIYQTLRNLAKVGRVVDLEELLSISEAAPDYLQRYGRCLEKDNFIARRATGWAVLDKAMKQADAPIYQLRKRQRAA